MSVSSHLSIDAAELLLELKEQADAIREIVIGSVKFEMLLHPVSRVGLPFPENKWMNEW